MINKLKINAYLKSNKGLSGSIEFLFITSTVFVLIFCFISTAPVFFKYMDLVQMTNNVVHATEGTGAIDSEINQLISQYRADLEINPSVQWDGGINENNHIQINEEFYLTLSDTYDIILAEPSFSGPIKITIPFSKKIRGVSGVYWKPDVY